MSDTKKQKYDYFWGFARFSTILSDISLIVMWSDDIT